MSICVAGRDYIANYVAGLSDNDLSVLASSFGIASSASDFENRLLSYLGQLAIAAGLLAIATTCALIACVAYTWAVRQDQSHKAKIGTESLTGGAPVALPLPPPQHGGSDAPQVPYHSDTLPPAPYYGNVLPPAPYYGYAPHAGLDHGSHAWAPTNHVPSMPPGHVGPGGSTSLPAVRPRSLFHPSSPHGGPHESSAQQPRRGRDQFWFERGQQPQPFSPPPAVHRPLSDGHWWNQQSPSKAGGAFGQV
jgi:hypothetical protein